MSIRVLSILSADDLDIARLQNKEFRSAEEMEQALGLLRKRATSISLQLNSLFRLFEGAATRTITIGPGGSVKRDGKVVENPKDGDSVEYRDFKKEGSRIQKVVVPNMKKLKDSFGLLQQNADQLELLESWETQVRVNFKDAKGKDLLKAIEKDKKARLEITEKALKFLQELGKKTQPQPFKGIINKVAEEVLESLNGRYEDSEQFLYSGAITDEDSHDVIWFTRYLQLKGLVNDEGFEHPTFYIVFTCKIKGETMTMYVNTLTDQKLPGRFRPGLPFHDVASGIRQVDSLMNRENFRGVLDALPIPVDLQAVSPGKFSVAPFIRDTEIKDNHLFVNFNGKVSRKNLIGIVGTLNYELRGLLMLNLGFDISHRTWLAGRTYSVEFTILRKPTKDLKEDVLDTGKLRRLKDSMGWDDAELNKFIRFVYKGF